MKRHMTTCALVLAICAASALPASAGETTASNNGATAVAAKKCTWKQFTIYKRRKMSCADAKYILRAYVGGRNVATGCRDDGYGRGRCSHWLDGWSFRFRY